MLLFKYFEKRAKPDPNGLLSSRVPSDESIDQPKGIRGDRGIASYISAELAASESGPCKRYS